jgi:hypothetical protein
VSRHNTLEALDPMQLVNEQELLEQLDLSGTTKKVKTAVTAVGLPRSAGRTRTMTRRLHRSRTAVAVCAGAVVTLLGVGIAGAVGLGPIDFVSADPAPAHAKQDFSDLSKAAPAAMDPAANPGEAREVQTVQLSDGAHSLSVTPTQAGGFCMKWSPGPLTCDRDGSQRFAALWSGTFHTLARPDGMPGASGPGIIAGFASSRYVGSVEIRFENGSVAKPDIAWVSSPINAGFFLYEIPSDGQHVVLAVTARDSAGHIFSEDHGPPPPVN